MSPEFEIEGQRLRAGLSIGIAVYPGDGGDAATLLCNADAALYRAKEDGRGTIRFFEAEMDKRLRERHAIQQDLQSAIARGELELYYQPQATIGGRIIGFEALLRWHHPSRGLIPPMTFIPIAEESGLIVQIGEWVLREACREAATWPIPLQVAVNLSPVQFRHGDLHSLVHTVLLETGLAAGRLELEITEGVLIADFARAVSVLRRLKALGVQDRDGRLRNRLFVAVLSAGLPVRQDQDRPVLHFQSGAAITSPRPSCAPWSAWRTASASRSSPRASKAPRSWNS